MCDLRGLLVVGGLSCVLLGCENLPIPTPPENAVAGAANPVPMQALESQVIHVPTVDGAVLALKRYPSIGATPVVLFHGLAVNGDAWDMPPVDGSDFAYRSLASLLRDCGYDVWLVNLRGHGSALMYSAPPAQQSDWCVDHFVLYDVPAAIEHVAAATGRRPFVAATSMGAMSLAGWLQGASLYEAEAPTEPRIVCDPDAAISRQAQIAGAVFIAFPAALRWPNSPIDEEGGVRWRRVWNGLSQLDNTANYPFELLSRSSVLQGLIELNGEVPLRWLRPDEKLIGLRERLPTRVAALLDSAEERLLLAGANFIGAFNGASHHRAAVILRGKRLIMEDMKAGVLRQMAKSVRARGFVSDLGDPAYVYSDHYAEIATPTLLVLGGRDRVANAQVAREVFFDVIASKDRAIWVFEEMGHGEFEAAPVATEIVYPEIISWISMRESASHSPRIRGGSN